MIPTNYLRQVPILTYTSGGVLYPAIKKGHGICVTGYRLQQWWAYPSAIKREPTPGDGEWRDVPIVDDVGTM